MKYTIRAVATVIGLMLAQDAFAQEAGWEGVAVVNTQGEVWVHPVTADHVGGGTRLSGPTLFGPAPANIGRNPRTGSNDAFVIGGESRISVATIRGEVWTRSGDTKNISPGTLLPGRLWAENVHNAKYVFGLDQNDSVCDFRGYYVVNTQGQVWLHAGGTLNATNLIDGPSLFGAANDKYVVGDGPRHRVLVINAQGEVWAHDFLKCAQIQAGAFHMPRPVAIGAGHKLNGPGLFGASNDRYVVMLRDRLLVINNAGEVWARTISQDSVGPGVKLAGPGLFGGPNDAYVVAYAVASHTVRSAAQTSSQGTASLTGSTTNQNSSALERAHEERIWALSRGTYADLARHARILRQYRNEDLVSHPRVRLGATTVDFKPLLADPMSLPMIAERLKKLAHRVEVVDVITEASEIDEGLVVHQALNYHIRPDQCFDAAAREELAKVGAGCITRLPADGGVGAFATPGNPRYIADPARRERAIWTYSQQRKQMQAEIEGHVHQLRSAFADTAQRTALSNKYGAQEVTRLASLSDERLAEELINIGQVSVDQILFVPKISAPQFGAPGVAGTYVVRIPPGQVETTHLGPYMYLTGFTLESGWWWKTSYTRTIHWFWGSDSTFSVGAYANLGYGLGLRFPIEASLDYRLAKGFGTPPTASVTTSFQPVDGTAQQYRDAGLADEKVFDGKEFVAQLNADAGLTYELPIFGSHTVPVAGFKLDLTEKLQAPFANGQFTPPASGSNVSTEYIFDQADMLLGLADFGFVGAHVFPAVRVGLEAGSLKLALDDQVTNRTTQIFVSGQQTDVGVAQGDIPASHLVLRDPVYTVYFQLTPGLDPEIFVDVWLWEDHWGWPVYFPQLSINLPPDGIDFACHSDTTCSRTIDVVGSQ